MNQSSPQQFKIVLSGPVGAGKTTAISSLSDIPVVATEETATDQTRELKTNTTVAMDFGLLKIPGGNAVHLYGTPGQQRFDYMWEVLTEGGLGLVLMISNRNPDPLGDLDYFMQAFDDFISRTSLAIGVTNIDTHHAPRIHDYQEHLSRKGLTYPVFDVDARQKQDVQILVQALLYSIN